VRKDKNGETGDDKCRQHDRAEGIGKRVTAVEIAVQAAAVMTQQQSDGASSAGRDKEIDGGGGKEGVLT
jgi:hypothetical protein